MQARCAWEEPLLNNISDKYSSWEYRNIALAVVAQCAQLVHALATTGRADPEQINACIDPLLVLNPETTADIYPNVLRFSSGLKALQQSLSNDGVKEFGEPIKYVLGMTVLQQQLLRTPEMQKQIQQRLQYRDTVLADNAQSEVDQDGQQQYDFAVLSALYQDTISKLNYRIHVKGSIEFLRDQPTADKIRSLLLAGIRSAVLWHQLGGRRWHLFIYKRRIRDCVAHVRRNLLTVH